MALPVFRSIRISLYQPVVYQQNLHNHLPRACNTYSTYTVKKVTDFPVSSQDITNQILPDRK